MGERGLGQESLILHYIKLVKLCAHDPNSATLRQAQELTQPPFFSSSIFKKLKILIFYMKIKILWAREDSNLHVLRHVLLRHACLPIPPLAPLEVFMIKLLTGRALLLPQSTISEIYHFFKYLVSAIMRVLPNKTKNYAS